MRKLLAIVCLATIGLVACGGQKTSAGADPNATLSPVPSEYAGLTNPLGPGAAEAGAEVFRINCEMCHGPQGHGDGPAGQSLEPKPGNLPVVQAKAEDDYLFWRIHDGKPGTSMVAWKGILTDEQMWQAISFIRTLR